MYTNFPWEIKYKGRFDPVTATPYFVHMVLVNEKNMSIWRKKDHLDDEKYVYSILYLALTRVITK